VFHAQCHLPLLARLAHPAPELARDGPWRQMLAAALTPQGRALRGPRKPCDWPGKTVRMQEVKQWLMQLDGQA